MCIVKKRIGFEIVILLIFPELIILYHGIYRIIYIFREWIRERHIFYGVFTEITDKIYSMII
jgi:hypothetical protein